jgi:hypothetical protein
VSKSYSALGGAGALVLTYLALPILLTSAAAALQADVRCFAVDFSVMFGIAYGSWIIGSNAHIAAVTPAELQKFGISWSLKLTNESGYIVALLPDCSSPISCRALPSG